jgi:4-amino-4-deoxy-L-arabinose transferase-like glycosyltransferase
MQLSDVLSLLRKNALRILLIFIPLLSAAMHWRVFQTDLVGRHVWRQAQTQTVVVNFYEEDFNILNPRLNSRGSGDGIRRLEFPLMQWLFAACYKVFDNHLIITRILSFVVGIFSVWGMYFLLNALFKNRLAAIAGAWALNFSPAFFYHTLNPLPDNFALCCGIWGLAFFFKWHSERKTVFLLAAGFFLSLAALCKLPFVIYFVAPFLYFLLDFWQKKEHFVLFKRLSIVSLFLIPPAAWYFWVIPTWDLEGVVTGIAGGPLPFSKFCGYVFDNLISIFPEMLINYAAMPLFIAGICFIFRRKSFRDGRFMLLAAIGLAVIAFFFYELNVIANVHDYYLFPFMPLLFILVAYGASQWLDSKNKFLKISALSLFLLMPFTAHLRTRNSWNPDSPGFNKDWLIHKEALRAATPDDALCVVGNDVSYQIFFYHIDKKGWAFTEDRLNAVSLKGMIAEGCQYFYSDTRRIDENPEIVPLLDKLISEKGSVRVFRLRK